MSVMSPLCQRFAGGGILYAVALGDEHREGVGAGQLREVFMKGIDHSYYYEGYTTFKTEEL